MAEFHLWKREVLEKFAEETAARIAEQDERIAQLEDDLRKMHEAWRKAIADKA